MTAATAGAKSAGVQLAGGLYAQRWTQAASREREYLVGAAEEQIERGAITGGAIARRLGKTPSQLPATRARLIAKGTLASNGQQLQFAIPGLGDYVLSVRDQISAHARGTGRGRRANGPER